MRPGTGGTQLADQFRQSVQAGGSGNGADEGPQDGWFVGVNGVPLGPIPIGDLKELAAAGHVDRRSLVWREGQAEWRPLGKFPQLARLLDDSGVSSVSQARPAVTLAREPEPSHSNGAAARPSATGFDMRPASSPEAQRPSAWGDLDEDDDEEQPTTVKGRVSVLPPIPFSSSASLGGGTAAAPFANESFAGTGLPVAFEGPPGNAPGLPRVADMAGAQIASPSSLAMGMSPAAALPADLGSGDLETEGLRGRGRGRIYAFVIVAVASLALGWTLRHVFWSGSEAEPAKPPASEPVHTQVSPQPSDQLGKAMRRPKVADEPSLAPGGHDLQRAGAGAAKTTGNAPSSPAEESDQSKAALVPPALASVAGIGSESAKPAGTASTSAPTVSRTAAGSLLSGLGTVQPPVGAGPRASADARGSSNGLDSTAIQRTVRRYAPAVKQACWQRALSARAPGVPSSAKVTATITVDATGHVSSVSAAGAPRGYPGLAHCIEDAVETWQFPRSAGESTTTVPFMFVGQ